MGSAVVYKDTLREFVRLHPKMQGVSGDGIDELIGLIADSIKQEVQILQHDDRVQISYPEVSKDDMKAAGRDSSAAARKAAAGAFQEAIPLFQEALALNPFALEARRDYAMALMELKDFDLAIEQLIMALCFNPDDAWTYVVLANYYLKEHDGYAKAEPLLRIALQVKPDDPWALNSLGALYAETGRKDESIACFEKAIEALPENPNPYYGLALSRIQNEDAMGAHNALVSLLKNAKMQDARSAEVMNNARSMFMELQGILAEAQRNNNEKALLRYKNQLESRSGYPIETVEEDLEQGIQATLQIAWKHRRDKHILKVSPGAERRSLNYYQIHELKHLEFECAAREAGRNKFFATSEKTTENALLSMSVEIDRIVRKRGGKDRIDEMVLSLIHGFCRFLYNCPIDMVIEHQIAHEFPNLWHEQFLGLQQQAFNSAQINGNKSIKKFVPNRMLKLSMDLNAAYAVFIDELFEGITDYRKEYGSPKDLRKAQKIFGIWKDAHEDLSPGDEYELVDRFAAELNVTDWYLWKDDPDNRYCDGPEGTTNPELLEEKQPASVFYLLDALKLFSGMQAEKVREISFEIAMLGRNGLDYSSPEKKYSLESLPGRTFSGLHLICMMYAGFKQFAPDMDTGADLDEPFLDALTLFNSLEDK